MPFVTKGKKKISFLSPGSTPGLRVALIFHVFLVLKLFVKCPTIWVVCFLTVRIKLCSFGRNSTKEKTPVHHVAEAHVCFPHC